MSDQSTAETHVFQAEAKQLLHLMTHSLYSNQEIFVRELISNAADACDKLRFEALDNDSLFEEDSLLRVRVETDEEAGTMAFIDNGIGMNREEVMTNLGTIAHSGTARFVENLTGDQAKDSALIGQFGVGFYSAFIAADKVEVFTRRAGLSNAEGVRWSCTGEAEYQLDEWTAEGRGTRIVLHLKEDAKEFASAWRLRSIIKKYSDHIPIPVEMEKPDYSAAEEGEDGVESDTPDAKAPEYEAVNSVQALWSRSRSDVSDEEYQEFYHYLSHDNEDAVTWSHNRIEGKLDYTSLLYIPANAPYDLWQRDAPRGLKLYIKRTFILDDAEQFLPLYLRFVKGVVDCDSLPLNVSREILQKSPAVDTIRNAVTKRTLDMLSKMAKSDPEKYQKFWEEFGQVIKEGPVEDASNKEKIAGLMRFTSTASEGEAQTRSLEEYIEAMQENQEKIYYLTGENYAVASRSPLLEAFRKKGIEVLLLTDRVDEWTMGHLVEFDGKVLQDVARGELPDLDKTDSIEGDSEEKDAEKTDEDLGELVSRIQKQLDERVSEVRISKRLVDSPACLVTGEHDMGYQMKKIMEAAGQAIPDSKPVLEINRDHPLIKKINDSTEETRFSDLTETVFDQAALAVGQQLDDPAGYVERINRLLLELS